MTHINHLISQQLVQFAQDYHKGLPFEDLSAIRQTSLQHPRDFSPWSIKLAVQC